MADLLKVLTAKREEYAKQKEEEKSIHENEQKKFDQWVDSMVSNIVTLITDFPEDEMMKRLVISENDHDHLSITVSSVIANIPAIKEFFENTKPLQMINGEVNIFTIYKDWPSDLQTFMDEKGNVRDALLKIITKKAKQEICNSFQGIHDVNISQTDSSSRDIKIIILYDMTEYQKHNNPQYQRF